MTEEIKVGDVLTFQGDSFRLLPKIEVRFGIGSTEEELPIEVTSPAEAYRVVRERCPNAHWQQWDEQYVIDDGYMFGYTGKNDVDGTIGLEFFAEPVDVIHEEFRGRDSPLQYPAGWITWYMAGQK